MNAQFRALGDTELWQFIKNKIEEEYGVKVVMLSTEIGIEGDYEKVKDICLKSCTISKMQSKGK